MYKTVEQKNGPGTLRKKWVRGKLCMYDEMVVLDGWENSLQVFRGGGAHCESELGIAYSVLGHVVGADDAKAGEGVVSGCCQLLQ